MSNPPVPPKTDPRMALPGAADQSPDPTDAINALQVLLQGEIKVLECGHSNEKSETEDIVYQSGSVTHADRPSLGLFVIALL